jgi:phosphate transport system protein
MGSLVENAIKEAVEAYEKLDFDQAQAILKNDEAINHLRFKIEEACIVLIATQQPAAKDLRAIVAVMHMVLELERMGDHAAGIAKTVIKMEEEPEIKTLKKIPKMGELSRQMLADCMQAFINQDTVWAKEIAARDDQMDEMYNSVFQRLIEIMVDKPNRVTRATYIMWCAHNLERIADRITNIAEQIIFITTGELGELRT